MNNRLHYSYKDYVFLAAVDSSEAEQGEEMPSQSSDIQAVKTEEIMEEPVEAEQSNEADAVEEDPELTKYWKTVNENPSDFTGWTYLLQYVEHEVSVF